MLEMRWRFRMLLSRYFIRGLTSMLTWHWVDKMWSWWWKTGSKSMDGCRDIDTSMAKAREHTFCSQILFNAVPYFAIREISCHITRDGIVECLRLEPTSLHDEPTATAKKKNNNNSRAQRSLCMSGRRLRPRTYICPRSHAPSLRRRSMASFHP